jgi:hypothetical protein
MLQVATIASLPPNPPRVVCNIWTSIEQACVAGWRWLRDAALVAPTSSHARRLGICPGGLHGDNGAAFIGSAVGCAVLNHVTRTPVYNVWNCTDSHRTRHSAFCSVGRWDEVGARVCVCGCTVAWPPCQSLRATKLSLLAEATLAKDGSACLQGCALPAPVCNTAVR